MLDNSHLDELKEKEKQTPEYILAIKDSDLVPLRRVPPPRPKPENTIINEGGGGMGVFILVMIAVSLFVGLLVVIASAHPCS